MLWMIAVVLTALWTMAMLNSYTLGGFIHLLLIALLMVLINIRRDHKKLRDSLLIIRRRN